MTSVVVTLPFDRPQAWGPSTLTVGPVVGREARAFIATHHYSGGGGLNTINVGLYHGMELVGVAAFGVPVSMDAAASVFGRDHADRVMDLQRLVLVDDAPRNTESWFIVRALRALKRERPSTWAVTSFADSTQGHIGTIYQATNAIYGGTGGAEMQFIDQHGRLRSNRMDGRRVTVADGADRGWTPIRRGHKHRYLFLTSDNRAHRRLLERTLLWERQPYPRADPDDDV